MTVLDEGRFRSRSFTSFAIAHHVEELLALGGLFSVSKTTDSGPTKFLTASLSEGLHCHSLGIFVLPIDTSLHHVREVPNLLRVSFT